MKEPKIGTKVRIHLTYSGSLKDKILQTYNGKIATVIGHGGGNGHIDIDHQSRNFLLPEDYSIIGFEDYLSEIERGENDESDSLTGR